MIGHGDGSSKREGASRVQLQLNPEVQVLTHLGEEPPMSVNNSSCSSTSTSSSSNFGEADSEGDAEVVDSSCEPVARVTMALAGARFMYSPLNGASDSDSELDLDNVELFCEEALALLAHEIVCCDCDSEIESEEEDDEVESGSEMESGSDQVDGYGQDNLSASTYQLMFSEEDEEEPLAAGNEKKDECPYVVESVLLLEEDQESEEKSDPGESQGNATPGCL